MTLPQQLLAIAKWDEPQYEWRILNGEVVRPSSIIAKEDEVYWPCQDYLSLDVLYECERKLTPKQIHNYLVYLARLHMKHKDGTIWASVHSSREERLEALVRTLNLWKD